MLLIILSSCAKRSQHTISLILRVLVWWGTLTWRVWAQRNDGYYPNLELVTFAFSTAWCSCVYLTSLGICLVENLTRSQDAASQKLGKRSPRSQFVFPTYMQTSRFSTPGVDLEGQRKKARAAFPFSETGSVAGASLRCFLTVERQGARLCSRPPSGEGGSFGYIAHAACVYWHCRLI